VSVQYLPDWPWWVFLMLPALPTPVTIHVWSEELNCPVCHCYCFYIIGDGGRNMIVTLALIVIYLIACSEQQQPKVSKIFKITDRNIKKI
jgi:hypothetical protein